MKNNQDQRPDPKPRKHPQLWQAYLWWDEMVEMRKRHLLRLSSIERGKSNLDAQFERDLMETSHLDEIIKLAKKTMVNYGHTVGPIWNSITSIKGLGEGGMAAQLLAQVDDIAKFDNVSKLWRFAGQAVIDGRAERNKPGEKSHFNRRLKSICWLISDQFIKQQTSGYAEVYYGEKKRQRELHPDKIKLNGSGTLAYTDAHIHNMAHRKVIKIFLQHFWVTWRTMEGLPVTMPYVHDKMGHQSYYGPDEFGWPVAEGELHG